MFADELVGRDHERNRIRSQHIRAGEQRSQVSFGGLTGKEWNDKHAAIDTSLADRRRNVGESHLHDLNVASRVETVTRSDPEKRSLYFYIDAAAHLADPLPYAVGKYRSRAFRRALKSLLAEHRFDLVVCDFLAPAVNLPARLPCPSAVFTHNVESEIWRRHADTKRNPLSRLLYGLQYRRMLRYEGRELARFDGVLAVSAADRDTFKRLYPISVHQPVHVVPTGVDTGYFHPARTDAASRELVFTGSMDWLPNEDAMLYFCREVLPLIRA